VNINCRDVQRKLVGNNVELFVVSLGHHKKWPIQKPTHRTLDCRFSKLIVRGSHTQGTANYFCKV